MLYSALMRGLAILLFGLACAVDCAGQGIITTVAGTTWIFRDNRKLATQAALGRLTDVLVDRNGIILAADQDNHIVVFITPSTGIVTVVAGNGVGGFSGEGGPGTRASLQGPAGLWLDGPGNLYIADVGNNRIRKLDRSGILRTIAGNGTRGFSGRCAARRTR